MKITFLMVSVLVRLSRYPSFSGLLLSFLLLFGEWVTLCFVGSSLEFLYLSLFVAGLHFPSAFVFVSLTPSAALSSCGFSQLTSYTVPIFSCSIHVGLQLCSTIPLICCTFFPYCWRRVSGKFSRLLPQLFSFDSSVPLRPLRLASSSIPSGLLCPWDSVAFPLPYRLLYIEPVVMGLVHSLPYRTLFLW